MDRRSECQKFEKSRRLRSNVSRSSPRPALSCSGQAFEDLADRGSVLQHPPAPAMSRNAMASAAATRRFILSARSPVCRATSLRLTAYRSFQSSAKRWDEVHCKRHHLQTSSDLTFSNHSLQKQGCMTFISKMALKWCRSPAIQCHYRMVALDKVRVYWFLREREMSHNVGVHHSG